MIKTLSPGVKVFLPTKKTKELDKETPPFCYEIEKVDEEEQ